MECLITPLNYISGRPGAVIFISSQELDREPLTLKFVYVRIFKANADFSQWGRNVRETQYPYSKVRVWAHY